MEPLIRVQELYKSYRRDSLEIPVLRNINLEILPSEFIAFMGPSGSGKTTLLNLIAGIDKPTQGRILIGGVDVGELNETELAVWRSRNVGFIFQFYNLIPVLTALENVELPLLYSRGVTGRQRRQRAVEMLDKVGLADRMDHHPGQLSGGQQQRVAIARALIHNPAVVLADEPTASLDTERAFQVVETFAKLVHENNRAGIMVTHDLRMCQYVDRILQMQDGKLVQVVETKKEIMELARGTMKH